MLFTERSVWTMIHGIVLGGGFLILVSGAIYCLWSLRTADGLSAVVTSRQCRFLSRTAVALALILWLAVIVGTFVVFPGYRADPPADATDLTAYPKALLKSNADTAWLHSIGMEVKEHMPWVAAILMTSVAAVAVRYGNQLAGEPSIRSGMMTLLIVAFGVVGFVALLGVFINKVAPLV